MLSFSQTQAFGGRRKPQIFAANFRSKSAVKQRGRERKGPPEIIQKKIRLSKWPISSAEFPMTPMERREHHFGPFFFWGGGEKDFGTNIPAAPSSPGPFGLLLTKLKKVRFTNFRGRGPELVPDSRF